MIVTLASNRIELVTGDGEPAKMRLSGGFDAAELRDLANYLDLWTPPAASVDNPEREQSAPSQASDSGIIPNGKE